MNESWQNEAHRRLGECCVTDSAVDTWVDYYTNPPQNDYWTSGEPVAWQLKLVAIREDELAGLDRIGFRALVRRKLEEVGDALMAAWEERNAEGRG